MTTVLIVFLYVLQITFVIAEDQKGIQSIWHDNKMGAIDSTGKLIIPIKYSSLAYCFKGKILSKQK